MLEKSNFINRIGYHPISVEPGRKDSCVACEMCESICPDFAICIEEVGGEIMPMGRMVSTPKQIKLGGSIINDNNVRFGLERMGVEEKETVKILWIDALVTD